MSETSDKGAALSPVKRAIVELRRARARIEALERAKCEPIAIIGTGLRFPGGANDWESFWRLLRDGIDTVTEVPAERWDIEAFYDPDPDAPGKMSTRWGELHRLTSISSTPIFLASRLARPSRWIPSSACS